MTAAFNEGINTVIAMLKSVPCSWPLYHITEVVSGEDRVVWLSGKLVEQLPCVPSEVVLLQVRNEHVRLRD
jgi:hypothetical protein